MSASSSNSAYDEILPLIPCPNCGSEVITWIAKGGDNPGSRFYKCKNKDVSKSYSIWQSLVVARSDDSQYFYFQNGCGFIRSTKTYRDELNRMFGPRGSPSILLHQRDPNHLHSFTQLH